MNLISKNYAPGDKFLCIQSPKLICRWVQETIHISSVHSSNSMKYTNYWEENKTIKLKVLSTNITRYGLNNVTNAFSTHQSNSKSTIIKKTAAKSTDHRTMAKNAKRVNIIYSTNAMYFCLHAKMCPSQMASIFIFTVRPDESGD